MKKKANLGSHPFGGGVVGGFIMEVKTDNSGSSTDTQFTIPTTGTGYNYDVSTSDGQTILGNTGNLTITFPSIGSYQIEITGAFPRIYFARATNDRNKLTKILQWGNIAWDTMFKAFNGCENIEFISTTDAPDLSGVTTLESMFAYAMYAFTESPAGLNLWDVSTITNFTNFMLFVRRNQTNFSGNPFVCDLSGWNMSNATTIEAMFGLGNTTNNAPTSFADLGDLGGWDLSGCALAQTNYFSNTFFEPFKTVELYNLSGWNTWVVQAKNISRMFIKTKISDASINNWDISGIEGVYEVFFGIVAPLLSFANWDFSNVILARQFLRNFTPSDIPLVNIDDINLTSNCTSIQNFFFKNDLIPTSVGSIKNFDITNINNVSNLATFETANYDDILITWEAQLQVAYPSGVGYTSTITANFYNSQFTLGGAAETARTSLITNYGWTINDAGGI